MRKRPRTAASASSPSRRMHDGRCGARTRSARVLELWESSWGRIDSFAKGTAAQHSTAQHSNYS